MVKNIDFYFDFGSPTAYLAFTQLQLIEKRSGANLVFHPILLGGIFKATGNSPPAAIPAKGKYMMRDLQRYAEKYQVPYERNPFFPINTLSLMRGAVSYQNNGDFERYVNVIFHNMWVEPKNLNDEDVLKKMLIENNFEYNDFLKRTSDQKTKDQLISNTEKVVQKGAFGAPTIFIGEEMFFGQDRMDFIEEYINYWFIYLNW